MYYRIALWLTILFALLASLPAQSKSSYLADLFAQAIKLGGYEQFCVSRGGCPMPGVAISKTSSPIIAGEFSVKEPGWVQISSALKYPIGSPRWSGVLVHEFIHYLQWYSGKLTPSMGCMDTVRKIEQPAYEAQARFLALHRIHEDYAMGLAVASANCNEE